LPLKQEEETEDVLAEVHEEEGSAEAGKLNYMIIKKISIKSGVVGNDCPQHQILN
jgi:hypothetical protein